MYRSFTVKNFRCFRELALGDLKRVNLIAGANNVGKTALLEALFLHGGAYNPAFALRLSAMRGVENVKLGLGRWVEAPWNALFHQFDISKRIELAGENTATGCRALRLRVVREPAELAEIALSLPYTPRESTGFLQSPEISQVLELEHEEGDRHGKVYMIVDGKGIRTEPLPPAPPFPVFFQSARSRIPFIEEAERFSQLDLQGKRDDLLQALKITEPRLNRLAVTVESGETMLQGDIGLSRLIPLPLMGEGIARLASLMLYISSAPNGVVLVDEIENGLHHSILIKVWHALGEIARQYNTQIFATTHNWECIVAAHQAFSKNEFYDLGLYRLDRVKENVEAVTYDQETLEAAFEIGMEIR